MRAYLDSHVSVPLDQSEMDVLEEEDEEGSAYEDAVEALAIQEHQLRVRVELEKLEMLFAVDFARKMHSLANNYRTSEMAIARKYGLSWLRETPEASGATFVAFNTGVRPSWRARAPHELTPVIDTSPYSGLLKNEYVREITQLFEG